MDNMTTWNAVKQVPPQFLKEIQAGRLRGKSDINPQWRYQVMTEQFGLCGVGWKWELKRLWTEPAGEQVFAFAEVAVYTKPTPQSPWSDPIPGIGGSMLIESEKAGLHANDEGYKMAITDAIGTGLKFLGVAADVYAGLWDGSKYRDDKDTGKATTEPEHFCKEHNTPFFMKGQMKSYAHPIGTAGEWCHEKPQETHTATKETKVVESVKPEDNAAQLARIKTGFEVLGMNQTEKGKAIRNWGLSFDTQEGLDAIESKINELVRLKNGE